MHRSIKKLTVGAAVIAGLGAFMAGPASAQTPQVNVEDASVLVDNAFVLICGALVIFMQAGFAMVEAGLTRAKNAAHMMLKNLLDFVVGAAGFAFIGYHIAFSGSGYLGFDWRWGGPFDAAVNAPNLTMPIHLFFNMGFAAAAATIVSGAVAERVRFRAYFVYAVCISTLIYPIVVGWTWGGGWLSTMDTPFIDFAGSTVVHATGGIAALVGAIILGPRIGRFDANGNSLPIPGHNLPMAILGVFILLIGWFGFNSGSLLGADVQIGMIVAMTALGGATGGIGATIASWLTIKTPDVTLIGNGVLGGLVGVTAGVANLSLFGTALIGLVSGVIATNGVLLLDRRQIDDPVGAVPVHLFCGVWGTIALGFLADPDAAPGGDGPAGALYGGGLSLLVSQTVGVVVICAFVAVATGTMFLILNSLDLMRVSPEVEAAGLDLAEHATPAYNDDFVDYDSGDLDDELDSLLDDLTVR
ncbi:MAG: ammonium transporter [Actinomycetota bacterium]